ncbi:MAG: SDR family NAD(P)-dependent oxidoreductase [Patescibacteria group bacterium]
MNVLPHGELLNLKGKVAVVTGGSVGIGFGISYRLAEAGAKVVIAARRLDEAEKTANELKAKGWEAIAVSTDVALEADVKNLLAKTLETYGKVDILVNNAGIFPFATLDVLTPELFDKVIATNLRGVFLTTKYFSEEMKKQNPQSGKIVNIASIDALHPSMAGLAHYDASKHGVWGFTKNVALELAKYNIQVNAIAPGGIYTPGVVAMQTQGKENSTERFPDAPKMDVPMGRQGVPDDIAKVTLFLASDMAGYMTGEIVVVDGGYLLK